MCCRRTERPRRKCTPVFASAPADEAELTAAVEQAAQLAADMGFGEWRFTAKTVESSTSGSGWQIELTGQPVYEGYPVNWQTLSKEETLEMESLTLHMANSGALIDLIMPRPWRSWRPWSRRS